MDALALSPDGVVVPVDGFHLADEELVRRGLRDRKGAPDVVMAPGFERGLEQPVAGAIPVPPGAALVVTEGNYLLLDCEEWRAVREQLHAVWHVRTDDDVRRQRLVARHVEFAKSPDAANLVLDLRAWEGRVSA